MDSGHFRDALYVDVSCVLVLCRLLPLWDLHISVPANPQRTEEEPARSANLAGHSAGDASADDKPATAHPETATEAVRATYGPDRSTERPASDTATAGIVGLTQFDGHVASTALLRFVYGTRFGPHPAPGERIASGFRGEDC